MYKFLTPLTIGTQTQPRYLLLHLFQFRYKTKNLRIVVSAMTITNCTRTCPRHRTVTSAPCRWAAGELGELNLHTGGVWYSGGGVLAVVIDTAVDLHLNNNVTTEKRSVQIYCL